MKIQNGFIVLYDKMFKWILYEVQKKRKVLKKEFRKTNIQKDFEGESNEYRKVKIDFKESKILKDETNFMSLGLFTLKFNMI